MFFDSHAHYDDERFNADRDELLQNLKNEDVHTELSMFGGY